MDTDILDKGVIAAGSLFMLKLFWKWFYKLLCWMFQSEKSRWSEEIIKEIIPVIKTEIISMIKEIVKQEVSPIITEIVKREMAVVVQSVVRKEIDTQFANLKELYETENNLKYNSLERRLEHINRNIRSNKQSVMMLNLECVDKIENILEEGVMNKEALDILRDQSIILKYINDKIKNSSKKDSEEF